MCQVNQRYNISHMEPGLGVLPYTKTRTAPTPMSSENVHYLGLFINHKLTWHWHVKIMATQARGTLKALHLLGNSIRGLDHGNWRLAYNAIGAQLRVLRCQPPHIAGWANHPPLHVTM